MKLRPVPTLAVLLGLVAAAAALGPSTAFGQTVVTTEPDPSFSESAVSAYRHPEVDTNVFLYINHWRASAPREGHGGLVERDILTPGDPDRPARKGAVLKYITAYRRAVCQPRCDTVPFKSADEQAFFYVCAGKGKAEAGGKSVALEEGTAVVMPAGLSYAFSNPFESPLEMIEVCEAIGPGFAPAAVMSVGTYRATRPSAGVHWAHIGRGFAYDVEPRFFNPMGFSVVSIDTFDMAQPHVHGPGTEEIWCQLKGTSLLLFGNRLLKHEPGEAFLVPPNNKVPHSSINPGDEPMQWLYFGNRHDKTGK